MEAIAFLTPPSYGITCTGITQSTGGATAQWDRDTSGTGDEDLRYMVTDGAGTVLFSFDDVRAVGSTAGMASFGYTVMPSFNPIRFRLTSPAGNGFPEQVLVDMVGDCAGLPVVSQAGQTVAVDPFGQFVIYTTTTPGCAFKVPVFQALDHGASAGATKQLASCGTVPEDVIGIDLLNEKNTNHYWLSFGGSLITDSKFLMKFDSSGNILTPATASVPAVQFGSTTGATALTVKGCCKLFLWIAGAGGNVYRATVDQSTFLQSSVKKTSLILADNAALQATQRSSLPTFLATERPLQVLKAFGVNKKGLLDGTSWRLSPATDGGHTLGGVSADGLAALSNEENSPLDHLYLQLLNGNGLPTGSPVVAGSGQFTSADISNLLANGVRYVVYATEDGLLWLQVVDGSDAHKMGTPILLN